MENVMRHRQQHLARAVGIDDFVSEARAAQMHVRAQLVEEDVRRQGGPAQERDRILTADLKVACAGRNGSAAQNEGRVERRLGLQNVGRWRGHNVESDLSLICLRLAGSYVMHLESELFAAAQQFARAGWKSGGLGAWDITGKKSVQPH